jgi:hypothetical protein
MSRTNALTRSVFGRKECFSKTGNGSSPQPSASSESCWLPELLPCNSSFSCQRGETGDCSEKTGKFNRNYARYAIELMWLCCLFGQPG